MLAKFRKAKAAEIEGLARAARAGSLPAPWQGKRPDFAAALKSGNGINVIAEYKRASPSRGPIRMDLSIEAVAAQYEEGGAAALSILTETEWFGGDLAFISRCRAISGLPILRKDFIFDPLQVEATAATPASALLLIVRMIGDAAALADLRARAESLGLAAVVEIFDHADLELARAAGARIIQVNARDLDTLKVDRAACLGLIGEAGDRTGEIWIAASGISRAAELEEARACGFDAALIGGALMDKPSPGAELARLLGRS